MPSVCQTSVAMRFRRNHFTPIEALHMSRDGAGFCTSCEAIVLDGIDDVGTPVCPVCGDPAVVSANDAQLGGGIAVCADERPTLEGMLHRDEKPRTSGSMFRRGAKVGAERREKISMSHQRRSLARRAGEAA